MLRIQPTESAMTIKQLFDSQTLALTYKAMWLLAEQIF